MDNNKTALPFAIIALATGFLIFTVNYNNHENYYTGELLRKLFIVTTQAPTYHIGGKASDSHYTITAKEYACQFWIADGALKVVRQNDSLKEALKNMTAEDTLLLQIRSTDIPDLQTEKKTSRIIGMTLKGQSLLTPASVEKEDRSTRQLNLRIGAVVFIAALGWIAWKSIRAFSRQQ